MHNVSTTTNGSIAKDSRNRIKVIVRVRPPFDYEFDGEDDFHSIISVEKDPPRITVYESEKESYRLYSYDSVFNAGASQREVYESIGYPIVNDVLNGVNGTLMAYGQTGTGKTYTMGILGSFEGDRKGLVPRCIDDIFSHMTRHSGKQHTWTCKISFMQIYMEMIQDLLNPSGSLQIKESFKEGVFIPNLKTVEVKSAEQASDLVLLGLQNRTMAPTLMNTTSSRSHTVLSFEVAQTVNHKTTSARLRLVDLAGSERVTRTQSSGSRLNEAKLINKSLSVLGNVISGLIKRSENSNRHIPFRDSKLTRVLKDVLQGNSNIVLIATISPAKISYHETLSTLVFAQRCMKVTTHAHINEKIDNVNYKLLAQQLQCQLAALQRQTDVSASTPMKHFLRDQHMKEELDTTDDRSDVSWSLVTALSDTLWELYEVAQYNVQSAFTRCDKIDNAWSGTVALSSDDIMNTAITKVQSRFPMKMVSFSRRKQAEEILEKIPQMSLAHCESLEGFVHYIAGLHKQTIGQILCMCKNLEVRDCQVEEMKREMVTSYVEKAERDRDYEGWLELLNKLKKEQDTPTSPVDIAIAMNNAATKIQSVYRNWKRKQKAADVEHQPEQKSISTPQKHLLLLRSKMADLGEDDESSLLSSSSDEESDEK